MWPTARPGEGLCVVLCLCAAVEENIVTFNFDVIKHYHAHSFRAEHNYWIIIIISMSGKMNEGHLGCAFSFRHISVSSKHETLSGVFVGFLHMNNVGFTLTSARSQS